MRNVRKLVPYVLIFMGLMLLIPMSSGCSGTGPVENNRFLDLLKLLPATAKESGGFALIDYELFRKANGISLYTSDDKKISFEDFSNILYSKFKDKTIVGEEALAFSSYYTGWDNYLFQGKIKYKYLGYDATYIDAEINNIGIRPNFELSPDSKFNSTPEPMIAAVGRFDPKTTDDVLSNHDEWPTWVSENYTSEQYHNITIHSWGGGTVPHLKNPYSPPHLDGTGRARPLAVSDKFLLVGSSVDDVKSMIDASLEKAPSLADVPEYSLLAKGMYDLGAFGAIFADETLANGYWKNAESYQGPRLKKFLTFGSGYARDEKGTYIALVLVHESSDNAMQNVSLLEQRIGASFTTWNGETCSFSDYIYDTQIRAEGNVLLAKLYTDDETLWSKWFLEQWDLVLHEQ